MDELDDVEDDTFASPFFVSSIRVSGSISSSGGVGWRSISVMKTTRITTTTRVSICDALVGGRRMTPQHHPKIGILLTNSGIFCDLRNFDFVFWKLRNSFLLARGPCRPCQQNFDLKFDFDVSTESGILQIQKKVDLGEKFRFCAKTCPRMERVLGI